MRANGAWLRVIP